ncbi:MAG: hypothetical protein J0M10_14120 [Chitinophagales bacterium]|nr:hypothetical protein [Chitinophagales bacterium]
MNKFIYFLITITAIITVYWTNYQWNWLQQQSRIIPVGVFLILIAGLLLKQKTVHKNLAWGLIAGSLTGFVLLAVIIIRALAVAAGM